MKKVEIVRHNLPASAVLCRKKDMRRSKKEHVWWEVQITGAMIELLFGSGDYWMLTRIHA